MCRVNARLCFNQRSRYVLKPSKLLFFATFEAQFTLQYEASYWLNPHVVTEHLDGAADELEYLEITVMIEKPEAHGKPEPLQLARMVQQAEAMRHAAHLLDEACNSPASCPGDFGAGVASPILLAQAAEIGLKALHWIEHGQKPRNSHDLVRLHDNLPQAVRDQLANALPEIPDPSCPHSPISARKGLRAILKKHAKALAEWRYSYEHRGLSFDTGEFKEALAAIIATCNHSYRRTFLAQQDGGEGDTGP